MQNQNNILRTETHIQREETDVAKCLYALCSTPPELAGRAEKKNVFILLVDKWWYSNSFQILFAMFFNTWQTIHFWYFYTNAYIGTFYV